MKLNRKLEYALMALKHMNQKRPGELTSAKEVSDQYGCPIDATAKVLQIMARNELLKSVQGAQGGYLIQKDLSRVSFFELSGMILGKTRFVKCLHGHSRCEIQETCNIISPMSILDEKLINFYQSVSLRELVETKRPRLSSEQEVRA